MNTERFWTVTLYVAAPLLCGWLSTQEWTLRSALEFGLYAAMIVGGISWACCAFATWRGK